MHYLGISLGLMGLISLKKNFRVKFPNDVIFNCVMPRGAKKKWVTVIPLLLLLAAVVSTGLRRTLRGACSSFTTSSDCQSVSLLEKLHDPSASELGRNCC